MTIAENLPTRVIGRVLRRTPVVSRLKINNIPKAHDIAENDFVDINMYPNPASDKVTISNTGLLELETISVYDLNGRLMIKNNMEEIESITIDTSILQSATYIIVIESKYRNIIKRLLIE